MISLGLAWRGMRINIKWRTRGYSGFFFFFLKDFSSKPILLYYSARECHKHVSRVQRTKWISHFTFLLFFFKDFLIKFFDYYLSMIGRIISELKPMFLTSNIYFKSSSTVVRTKCIPQFAIFSFIIIITIRALLEYFY